MTADKLDLKIGGITVPNLITYSADKILRRSNINYNANGDMLVDLVSRKYLLTVYTGLMNYIDYSAIISHTSGIFFPVTFYAADVGITTRNFFMRSQPQKIKLFSGGAPYYEATAFQLEEM